MTPDLQKMADQAEQYINEHLFDPNGLMYSHIDVLTGKPFRQEDFKPSGQPCRVDTDPVAYWSYEDSIMATGFYIAGLVLKYEVTGDATALDQAYRVWDTVKTVYYASQVYGIGNFLRPYGGFAGGFEGMIRWAEPLGTDQAWPLLIGQYALWKHAEGLQKKEIADIIIRTLSWYEQQNFRYVWYRSLIHYWDVGFSNHAGQHAGNYYIPAIAFAARVTGDDKWQKLLEEKLLLFQDPRYDIYQIFDGALAMLADMLPGGTEFRQILASDFLDRGYQMCKERLATYTQPDTVRYVHSEAANPGFEPYTGTIPHPCLGDWCIHRGRERSLEFRVLCGLAVLNYPRAAEEAVASLRVFERVPEDFTVFLLEDHDQLPEECHTRIQARCVGERIVEWYMNYWMLRKAARSPDLGSA